AARAHPRWSLTQVRSIRKEPLSGEPVVATACPAVGLAAWSPAAPGEGDWRASPSAPPPPAAPHRPTRPPGHSPPARLIYRRRRSSRQRWDPALGRRAVYQPPPSALLRDVGVVRPKIPGATKTWRKTSCPVARALHRLHPCPRSGPTALRGRRCPR